jgi:hypothetical protein
MYVLYVLGFRLWDFGSEFRVEFLELSKRKHARSDYTLNPKP